MQKKQCYLSFIFFDPLALTTTMRASRHVLLLCLLSIGISPALGGRIAHFSSLRLSPWQVSIHHEAILQAERLPGVDQLRSEEAHV